MKALLVLSVGAARNWVALYTLGLPLEGREARRSEIDCDLWEQQHLAGYMREPPLGTAAEIVARTVLGMLCDITWRVQGGTSARPDRSAKVNDSLATRGLFVVALAIAASPIILGGSRIAGQGGGGAIWGSLVVLVGCVLLAGILLIRRNAMLGIRLTAAGAIGIAVLFFWMFFVVIPALVVVGVIVYYRARQTGWPRRAGTA